MKCILCEGKGYYQINEKHYPCNTCGKTGDVEFKHNEKPPYAWFMGDESLWTLPDVTHYYPEIVEYHNKRGIFDIVIKPCGPVDEDCLYLDGKWSGYCRTQLDGSLIVNGVKITPRKQLVNKACSLVESLYSAQRVKWYDDKSMRKLRTQTWITYYEDLRFILLTLGELLPTEKNQITWSALSVKRCFYLTRLWP